MFKRLIPSILIHEGRLVKGKNYADYRDAGNPATTARAHNAQGADELIVCDIDAARNNTAPDLKTLAKVAEESFMPLTVFGGIKDTDTAARCMDIGADKIGLTSSLYDNSKLAESLAHRYGAQAIVLGLDIMITNGTYALYDHRTSQVKIDENPFDWAENMVQQGCGEIRLMSVDNEGTLTGFDINAYNQLKKRVNVPIILEGGAGSLDHLQDAYENGVDAIALGAILVFSDANLVKIKQHMRSKEIKLRS